MKHFSLPRGLVPCWPWRWWCPWPPPASAFFWQKKENTPAGVADFSKNTLAGGSVTFPRRISGPLTCPSITPHRPPGSQGRRAHRRRPAPHPGGGGGRLRPLSGLTFQSLPTPGVSTRILHLPARLCGRDLPLGKRPRSPCTCWTRQTTRLLPGTWSCPPIRTLPSPAILTQWTGRGHPHLPAHLHPGPGRGGAGGGRLRPVRLYPLREQDG